MYKDIAKRGRENSQVWPIEVWTRKALVCELLQDHNHTHRHWGNTMTDILETWVTKISIDCQMESKSFRYGKKTRKSDEHLDSEEKYMLPKANNPPSIH